MASNYGISTSTGAFLTSTKQSVQVCTVDASIVSNKTINLNKTVVLSHENVNVFKNGLLLVANTDYKFSEAFNVDTSDANYTINFTDKIILTNAPVVGDKIVILYNTFGGDGLDTLVFDEYINQRVDKSDIVINANIEALNADFITLSNAKQDKLSDTQIANLNRDHTSYLTSVPVSSTSTLGGVKIGTNLVVTSDGVVSVGTNVATKTWVQNNFITCGTEDLVDGESNLASGTIYLKYSDSE